MFLLQGDLFPHELKLTLGERVVPVVGGMVKLVNNLPGFFGLPARDEIPRTFGNKWQGQEVQNARQAAQGQRCPPLVPSVSLVVEEANTDIRSSDIAEVDKDWVDVTQHSSILGRYNLGNPQRNCGQFDECSVERRCGSVTESSFCA